MKTRLTIMQIARSCAHRENRMVDEAAKIRGALAKHVSLAKNMSARANHIMTKRGSSLMMLCMHGVRDPTD